MLIVLDKDANISMINKATLDLLGYQEEELLGQSFDRVVKDPDFELFTPDSLSKVAFIRDKEITFINKNQTQIDVSYSLSVIRGDSGEFLGTICVGHNITDRKINEAERTRWEQIFQNLQSGVAIDNLGNGTIDVVNPSFAKLLGYSEEELIGKPVIDVYAKEFRKEMAEKIIKIQESGKLAFEALNQHKDGSIIPTLVSASTVKDEQGNVLYRVVNITDITERKNYENRLKAALNEKEILIKEIHHRVKNNLQIVSSLLYLQSKRTQDQNSISILKDSQNRVKAMALIHEKLYQSADLASVDLGEYLEEIVLSLFKTYGINRKDLTYDINIDGIKMGIDIAIPIGMIVNELASNALKHAFSANAKGRISISVVNPKDGEYILKLSDNGKGFPTNFDFKNTNSLGLQLVNNLVSQLNGELKLNRTKKKTEFILTVRSQSTLEGSDA